MSETKDPLPIPKFSPATPSFYVNHIVVASSPIDVNIVFGHLSGLAGFKGMEQTPESVKFDALCVVTMSPEHMALMMGTLIRHAQRRGMDIDAMVKAATDETTDVR